MAKIRTEECKHGTSKWCEDCVTESWTLASADGYERGLAYATTFLRDEAGRAFAENKDDDARLIRVLSRRIEAELDNARAKATDIRKAQGILR
jgi:hypothetical protein